MSPIEVFRFAFAGAFGAVLAFVVLALVMIIIARILEE